MYSGVLYTVHMYSTCSTRAVIQSMCDYVYVYVVYSDYAFACYLSDDYPYFHGHSCGVLQMLSTRVLFLMYYQELMSHPKGGEGAFNYVVTALSKVLAVL